MDTPDFISRKVLEGEYYFLDLEPDRAKSVAIVCGGRETCGANYQLERETFPYWSVEYVLSGHGRLAINGDSFPIGPGTLFRYGPGIRHSIEVSEGSILDKTFVDFVGTAPASWWTGPWESLKPLHVPARSGVHLLFESLMVYGRRGGTGGSRLCALVAEQIVVVASEEAIDIDLSQSHAWETYIRCRQEIETHFLTLRTLGEIALHCHVGEAWLCRLFSRFDSTSPYQYLVGRKMAHAASRLADPTALVKEVASEVGYDPYHFSNLFKKTTGFSPQGFRASIDRSRS